MEMTAGDILRNTKKINIALDTYLNERLASTDLTAAQGNVLFFILEHSGVHSTRIHKQAAGDFPGHGFGPHQEAAGKGLRQLFQL